MAVTIKEIAGKAGVSFQAVSAVLNGNTKVASAATREKILMIARELDYRPNAAARALSSGKTGLIGFITQDIRFPFYSDFSYQIQACAESYGYKVLMLESNWDNSRTLECLSAMLSYSIDGILMIGNVNDKEIYKLVADNKLPLVFIDGEETGFSGHGFDYRPGMRDALSRLVRAGCRRFALADDNCRGLKRRMFSLLAEEFGLDTCFFDYRYPTVGGEAQVVECGRAIAAANPRPDALIIGSDYDAALIIQGISECGLRIPDDISIVAIDDTFVCRLMNPKLSAIRLDRELSARLIVEQLVTEIREPIRAGRQIIVSSSFIDRDSIRPESNN